MKRRRYLIFRFFWGTAVSVILLFILMLLMMLPDWAGRFAGDIPAAAAGICILYALYFYFLIYRPYRKIRRQMSNYTQGYTAHMQHSDAHISPDLEQYMDRMHRDIQAMEAIKHSNKLAEYQALQNQINPHFLYNTLEGIRSDALAAGVDQIAGIVESLARFFRYTISKIDRLVPLEQELIHLRTYLAIQNYRFGNRIRLEELFDDCDRSVAACLVPKLLFQPLVENAIIHGLEKKVGEGLIRIIFTQTEKTLLITIEDNGIGMDDQTLQDLNNRLNRVTALSDRREQNSGIAINNVDNRIKLLFGERFGLRIRSILGFGTSVEIVLPLVMQQGELDG